MARLLTALRRLFLFVTAVVVTFVIHLISLSVGQSVHEGRGAVIVSDRGTFKQVAFRISKIQSDSRLAFSLKLGFSGEGISTSYMVRITNFFPFIMLENLGVFADMSAMAPQVIFDHVVSQSCSDGDGGGDGGRWGQLRRRLLLIESHLSYESPAS